jgi:probable H4MPT-linked C1 transfer pathway protein
VTAWIGLDVGGAHLKLARARADGRITHARQVGCALWQGLDRLDTALEEAMAGLPPGEPSAITMTAELVDLFPGRTNGVVSLVRHLMQRLPGRLRWWTLRADFLSSDAALARPLDLASANWLATASLAARRMAEGLLLDIGSTTADIVPFAHGRVQARGLSDRQRLASEELIYTGATRTPLMALTADLPVLGERVPLMREHFATTADVWRILGLLPDSADQHPAADNGPKTRDASLRRLGRMVGLDRDELPEAAWTALARVLAREQEQLLLRGVERQLSRGLLTDRAPILAAGSGDFIARRLADQLDRPCIGWTDLVEAEPQAEVEVSRCAPAVAVALLAGATC